MKLIPLKIQKIIMYIPYVNILCLFLWTYNSFFLQNRGRLVLRTMWILFSTTVPFLLLSILFERYVNKLELVAGIVGAYFVPLIIAYRLIRFQELLHISE